MKFGAEQAHLAKYIVLIGTAYSDLVFMGKTFSLICAISAVCIKNLKFINKNKSRIEYSNTHQGHLQV